MVAGFIAGCIQKTDYILELGWACGNATTFSAKLVTGEEIDSVLCGMSNTSNYHARYSLLGIGSNQHI